MEDLKNAAAVMGKKGGSSRSEAKASAARKNGKLGGRPSAGDYAVVVAYDCLLGQRGTIISWHSRHDLAELKARRSGFDSFLRIAHRDELQ